MSIASSSETEFVCHCIAEEGPFLELDADTKVKPLSFSVDLTSDVYVELTLFAKRLPSSAYEVLVSLNPGFDICLIDG